MKKLINHVIHISKQWVQPKKKEKWGRHPRLLMNFGTVAYIWFLIGVTEAAMISSGCDNIPTEAETRSQFRRRRAVVTRRLIPFASSAPVPFASSIDERSRQLLEEVSIISDEDILVAFHDCSSFLVLVVSDHFSSNPVVTPINATRHQLVTLIRSICAGEGTNSGAIDEQWLLSSYRPCMFLGVCSSFAWLFTGLNDVLGRMERMVQRLSHAVRQTFEITDTGGDETEGSESRRRARSKRT